MDRGKDEGLPPQKSVLIVDDDTDFAESLVDILEMRGYRTGVAHGIETSRRLVEDFDPDIALIDIRLGHDSGIDLVAALRQACPGILCVMMTAYPETSSAIEAIKKGAYDYLRKPFDAQDLLATLERCFDRLHIGEGKARAEASLRRRNEELREANERLRRIVNSATGLAACKDYAAAGRRLLEEFARSMGATGGSLFMIRVGELVRAHVLDPGHAPDRIALPLRSNSPLGRALTTKQPVFVRDIEKERLEPSSWRGYEDASLLVFPICDDAGAPIAVVSLHNKQAPPFTPQDMDIGQLLASFCSETLRAVQATDALTESEARFRELFERSNDAVFVHDLDGGIVDVNAEACRMLDLPRTDLIGTAMTDLHPQDCAAPWRRAMRGIAKSGATRFDSQFKRRDGSTLDVEISASALGGTEKSTLIQAIARDVTESRQHRARLERTVADLATSNAELQRFAWVASHDLQEPLRNVSAHVQLLQRRYGDKLDEEARESIGYAVEGARRMQALTHDLLDYSRVGTQGRRFRPTDCNTVLKDTLAGLAESIEESQARITADPLPTIALDGAQLGLLLRHLIDNAVKFRGGAPPRIHLSAELRDGEWVFSVQDSGIGIDGKYLDRVFVIYQRLHAHAEYPGTGIGLALCKRIVEHHGGRIWAESKVGEGSIFRFTIPAERGGGPEGDVNC